MYFDICIFELYLYSVKIPRLLYITWKKLLKKESCMKLIKRSFTCLKSLRFYFLIHWFGKISGLKLYDLTWRHNALLLFDCLFDETCFTKLRCLQPSTALEFQMSCRILCTMQSKCNVVSCRFQATKAAWNFHQD